MVQSKQVLASNAEGTVSANPRARPDHKRKSFANYGWYAVLGIFAMMVGAALGLAVR